MPEVNIVKGEYPLTISRTMGYTLGHKELKE